MKKSMEMVQFLLIFQFFFNVVLGVIEIVMKKPEYSIPSNMGWIVIFALVYLVNKDLES